MAVKSTVGDYHLTNGQGKQVQEVLRRYLSTLKEERALCRRNRLLAEEDRVDEVNSLTEDIDYVTALSELFD